LIKKDRPIYELALAHYGVRAGLPAEQMKWTQRALDINGLETMGSNAGVWHDHLGWGGLTFHRTAWMAGDPVTFNSGNPVFGIHTLPATIKAVDFDFYNNVTSGEGHTYHDLTPEKSEILRTSDAVDIAFLDGNYWLTDMENGEWLNYTVASGKAQSYRISVTYQASDKAELSFTINNGAGISCLLPATSTPAEGLIGCLDIPAGASVLKMTLTGLSNVLQIKDIKIESGNCTATGKSVISASNDDPIVAVRYYTPTGIEVMRPSDTGVYIVRQIMQSGKEKINKATYNNQ
jgi:hypothetical protein